ncbi:MAG: DUF1116 domain-containing protein [Eubacteriales bacterium]|nr:DUF1116 domain-containing protein [Eubacteriales bacterium]
MNSLNRLTEIANQQAIERIQSSRIFLTEMSQAKEKIPFFDGYTLLHSGPPLEWSNMNTAMRNAICGAIVYEGWAENLSDAFDMADQGKIKFGSDNENNAVGPMAGIISPTMPVFVFENQIFGNKAYVTINEGLGKTLRFGANDESVIERLKWIEKTLAPILKEALLISGPIDITSIITQGIQRGDECHNRNKASNNLFVNQMAPWMVKCSSSREDIAGALTFMAGNDHFFLNLSMGNSKATMDAIHDIEHCSIVSCMSTNGYQLGIQVSGTGRQWFTAPSPYAKGKYFEGYDESDASTVMGDSYISEACGIGAFAMGASLGIGQFIGIDTKQAQDYSLGMYEITVSEHEHFKIPVFDFRGTPLGIDIRKVISSGRLPIINTGIAYKNPGVGQIGAGIVYPPMACFRKAYESYLQINQ